jgi:glycosyltransferase involved in cell wall biosynthesis
MPQISAVIITYNEERDIERCLNSIQDVADEIIVVDSFSTDKTEDICKKYNVKFFQHTFKGYRDQKNYALSLASNDHILSLDADEALSEKLKKSITEVKNNWHSDGYSFNRSNNYCGQWIHHTSWYPDRKIRLFNSQKGKWGGLNLHETVEMVHGSKVSILDGDLLHWAYYSYEEHIQKINNYSTLGAQEYFNSGKKSGPFSAVLHSRWAFFKSYFIKRGFLDGYYGFVISTLTAYKIFLKYIKLRKLIEQNNPGKQN